MIWVIGSRGMLGQELVGLLRAREIPHCASDLEVSITSVEQLRAFAKEHQPSWIVNCAAYTAVDQAEDDVAAAYTINAEGAQNIAVLAAERDIPVIHISTDYVFDGNSGTPLTEAAPTGPVGVYGASKLTGEHLLRAANPRHFILRTAWLYGKHGRNFVYTMLKLMESHDELTVVDDQVGSPTWTRQLAGAITHIVSANSTEYGAYHFSGDGQTSWHGFAARIYVTAKRLNLIRSDCRILPCTSDEFPTKAKRPAFSLLDKTKIKKTFGLEIEPWQTALSQFLTEITADDIT